MSKRITNLFDRKKEKILSVFYTAGFPQLNDTVAISQHLEKAGADSIEIGIPFSDPIADGPTIQYSNKVALENGMTVSLLLDQLKEIRKTVSIPIVLMGYLNPVYQYGVEKFIRKAKEAGADGFIFPDMPVDEYENLYKKQIEELELFMAFLVSPTTSPERIQKIDSITKGFIYAVSSSSTTGGKLDFGAEQIEYFKRLESLSLQNPFLVGFGISNHESFSQACKYGRGAIIGSAFINLLRTSNNKEKDIQKFIQSIKSDI